MQIPGGDLAPARRRRYGGGYGRRRRRRSVLVVLGLVLALAAVAWIATREHPRAPARAAVVPRCASPSASPTAATLNDPKQVRLTLLNGTSRNGLAKTVKTELVKRGFVVLDAANAPAALSGPSRVVYGPGGLPGATLVAKHVLDAITVSAPSAAAGSVQLTLGSDYRRLASEGELAARSLGGPGRVPVLSPSPCV